MDAERMVNTDPEQLRAWIVRQDPSLDALL